MKRKKQKKEEEIKHIKVKKLIMPKGLIFLTISLFGSEFIAPGFAFEIIGEKLTFYCGVIFSILFLGLMVSIWGEYKPKYKYIIEHEVKK